MYFKKGADARLSQNYEPGNKGFFYDTTSVPLNVGGYSLASGAITIPANGVYEISYCMVVKSENDGSDIAGEDGGRR